RGDSSHFGALNRGLARMFQMDFVAILLHLRFSEASGLTSVFYGLVGLPGLCQALGWKAIQRGNNTATAA
ncbi:MAG: DUF378 domain-containing protein, partial [Acidobacteria bacterium]|nr:DUF378 domain-containing protein [Acidobacteriota bacterium]